MIFLKDFISVEYLLPDNIDINFEIVIKKNL